MLPVTARVSGVPLAGEAAGGGGPCKHRYWQAT